MNADLTQCALLLIFRHNGYDSTRVCSFVYNQITIMYYRVKKRIAAKTVKLFTPFCFCK